jgi:small subunit ribosomal protein S13
MAEEKINQEQNEEKLVRILSKDIRGNMSIYAGLTKIKGISWGISNAICKKLKIDKKRKIASLSKDEIEKITNFLKTEKMPHYLLNRRKDFETGEDFHLIGSDLDLKKEFDIKRLKKIKSYKGYRHLAGLPARGQRTRSNFRKNKLKRAGIKSKKK